MIHKNNSQKVKRSILTSYNSLQLIWGPQMIPPQAFQGVICLDNRKSFLCVINILVVLSLSESPALSKENSNTVYRCLRAANVMTILVPPIENKGWKYHPWEGFLLGGRHAARWCPLEISGNRWPPQEGKRRTNDVGNGNVKELEMPSKNKFTRLSTWPGTPGETFLTNTKMFFNQKTVHYRKC